MKIILFILLASQFLLCTRSSVFSKPQTNQSGEAIDLTGEWEGYYLFGDKNKYTLILHKISDNKYIGISKALESKSSKFARQTMRDNRGKEMDASVVIRTERIEVRQGNYTAMIDALVLVEEGYRNNVSHFYWELKKFYIETRVEKGKTVIVGSCNHCKWYYQLRLERKSISLNEEQNSLINEMLHPKIKISEVSFKSETGLSYLSFPNKGIVTFKVTNESSSSFTPPLGMRFEFSTKELIEIYGANTINGESMQSGKSQICTVMLHTKGNLIHGNIELGLVIESKYDKSEIAREKILIPIQ